MRFVVAVSSALSTAFLGMLGGCGDAAPRSTERFCGELAAHVNEIRTPPTSVEEVPALITLYSKMGEVAPLEIETDWDDLYGSLKVANTVNVNDPASMQAAADKAYATQKSAQNVVAWAQRNCALDLGAVGGVVGGVDTVPPTAATTATSG
jgi:hypothetical protein